MNQPQHAPFPELSRSQVGWIIFSLLVAGWLLWRLGPVLTPFFIRVLIAYIVNPLVGQLERLKIQRSLAVAIVFALAFGLIAVALLIIIPVLVREIADFMGRLPGYIESLRQTVLPWLEARLDIELNLQAIDVAKVRELIQGYFSNIAGVAGNVLGFMTESGGRFIIWISSVVLIPLVTFYLLRDWQALMKTLRGTVPRNIEPTRVALARDRDEALSGNSPGQLRGRLELGGIYSIGLRRVGSHQGAIVGALLAGHTAVVQDFSLPVLLSVAVVFVAGQLIERFVLTPRLVGDRIGLHPVLVIFTVMAGGQLFGFAGVLLALPAAAAGTVIVRFGYNNYELSRVYRAEDKNNLQD